MLIRNLVVSFDDNELAERAFRTVVAEVWMEGRVKEDQDQEMGDFFTTFCQAIKEVDWIEGQGMQFIRFGDRYIFYHFNGSSIQYHGGEISIEFAPTRPYFDQETLEVLKRVEAEARQTAGT